MSLLHIRNKVPSDHFYSVQTGTALARVRGPCLVLSGLLLELAARSLPERGVPAVLINARLLPGECRACRKGPPPLSSVVISEIAVFIFYFETNFSLTDTEPVDYCLAAACTHFSFFFF